MKNVEELYYHFLQSKGVTTDSRSDVTNKIFFALSGENFNGNKFAHDAISKGASLCVIDDPSYNTSNSCFLVPDALNALQELAHYHRSRSNAKIIAITGSNGKTTTKELISSVLSSSKNIISTYGNLNNHIGVPLTILKIDKSTQIAVVEMGANHVGEIARLCEIAMPDIGLITNIGKAHLEGFGSFEGVIKAKSELYQYLIYNNGTAIVNSDDELLMRLSSGISGFKYGSGNADVLGEITKSTPHINIRWKYGSNNIECNTKLIGRYNFYNTLAAIAIGIFFDVAIDNINEAIESYIPENNRSQQIITKDNSIVLDAYNANPTSMNEAIESFAESKPENPWLILGDMFELGSYSGEEHQKIVDTLISKEFFNIILVGNDFHSTTGHQYLKFEDTESAIKYLIDNKLCNADILVKGSRGMKLEQILEYL